jgi:UDP-3-O-[3-hydroxymyristoyl] glucosamine N-acyltransferase
MPSTVHELAALVGGDVHGDGSITILAARAFNEAETGHVTFAENEKHLGELHTCRASAAVVPVTAASNGKALIRVADPRSAFIAIARHLHGRAEPPPHGIDPKAHIDPTVQLGADVSVHAFAVIGAGCVIGARCRVHSGAVVGRDCRLGDDVTLFPHVILYDDTVIGNRVIVHANAVIGADGFGYQFRNGRYDKIPQLGHVEIADDVEIGAGATVDRGTFGPTRVGEGTKIDNLVMVGHNCRIGRHNVLVGQSGFAGSCDTGDYVVVAGQAGIVDHVTIGAGAILSAQAGVTKDVAPQERMLGSPAQPEYVQKRNLASLASVPEMRKRLRAVEKRLGITGETEP